MKLLMNYSYNRIIIILDVFAIQFLHFQCFDPILNLRLSFRTSLNKVLDEVFVACFKVISRTRQRFCCQWLSFVLMSVSLNDANILKSVNLSYINCCLLDLIFVVYLNNKVNNKILQFNITSIARFS